MALRVAPVSTLLERRATGELLSKCREILSSIQEEVKLAAEKKQTQVIFSMPTVFDISNTPNDRAQQFVYYNVMCTLEKANYIVKIKFTGHSIESQHVTLYITWKTVERKRDEQIMDLYISKHKIS